MEVSETMRPRRSFIMRLRQPFESRNTLVRFVAITASQSSGFMRRSKRVARDGRVVHQDGGHLVAGIQVG